jgi:hypothetical protein
MNGMTMPGTGIASTEMKIASICARPENAKALWRKSEEMVGETFA